MSDIFTANADGTNPINVTMNSADQNSDPKWVDTGNTIVFAKRVTGHSEIWVISAGGGPARQLTDNNVGHDFLQDASPQGLVAYNHQTSIDAGQVGIIDINGTGEHFFNAPGGTNSRAARFPFANSLGVLRRTACARGRLEVEHGDRDAVERRVPISVKVTQVAHDTPEAGLTTVRLRIEDCSAVVVVDRRGGPGEPVRFRFVAGAHPWQTTPAETRCSQLS